MKRKSTTTIKMDFYLDNWRVHMDQRLLWRSPKQICYYVILHNVKFHEIDNTRPFEGCLVDYVIMTITSSRWLRQHARSPRKLHHHLGNNSFQETDNMRPFKGCLVYKILFSWGCFLAHLGKNVFFSKRIRILVTV